MLLFPLPFAKTRKMETQKVETNRLCTMYYEAGLYSVGCKEMIAVDKAVF